MAQPDSRKGKPGVTRRDFVRIAGGATAIAAGGGLTSILDACGATSGPSGPSKPVEADVSKLYDAAKKDGKLTWWTAHYEESAAQKMKDAFKAKYPGIEVTLFRQTAQVIYNRLTQDLTNGVNEVDVFASTDEAHYLTLKQKKALASYTPPDLDLIPKDLQVLDPDHQYHLGALGFVLINYRTDKVSSPPKKWTDLLDPQWKDKITTGHPGYSGYVGNWVVAMIDQYGDDYLKKLKANNPKISQSINGTVNDIVGGERQVGAGPDNFSLAKKAAGNAIDIYYPDDKAILITAPVGIMDKAPNPNAARLFVNFMFSKEYSQALVSTYNYPLRSDVSVPAGSKTLDQIKWYRNQASRLEKGIPAAKDKWREIMGV